MRLVGGIGTAFFALALVVDLGVYINLHRLSNAALPETYRTLFTGLLIFPLGLVLSGVLLRLPPKGSRQEHSKGRL